jgi:predicted O-linked N-acetylglucosamine transferase (SPINDLY family)
VQSLFPHHDRARFEIVCLSLLVSADAPRHRRVTRTRAQIAAADWTRGAGAGTDAVTARIRAHCDRFEVLYEEVSVEIAQAAAPPPAESAAVPSNAHATTRNARDDNKSTESSEWFDVLLRSTSFDEARIAQRIAALAIDVLIDLQGWSDGRRLTTLCARAAPIQVPFLAIGSYYFARFSVCFWNLIFIFLLFVNVNHHVSSHFVS